MENFMLIENELSMEKIIKKDGYVYLVQDWDRKGFETFYNLGKDPEYWEKENKDENPKQKKGRIKKEED